ncbi:MAG: hypothetical protein ACE145_09555 [Terriglobia bacterium]
MSFDVQRLAELLPAIYRIRDSEQGGPLRDLLSVIADQIAVLEENLDQLYDDQFIETCAEWVVPYIGDLIGYRTLYGVVPRLVSRRAEVAHTIAFRRRKGTATMLEQLARDVTGWDARAVEFFQLLGWSQYMNHLRPEAFYAPDLRQWELLERLNTPFDRILHTAEVRRISTGQGRYNIPNVGISLWRLRAYPLTDSPAFRLDDHRFLFHPLGSDTQLFTKRETEDEITHLAEHINVPDPISRRVLDAHFEDYYGPEKSLFIAGQSDLSKIVVCDLTGWVHTPPAGKVAIDPVLGRIRFADAQTDPPHVTFHYGFSTEMGGGEYDRLETLDALLTPIEKVPAPHATVQDALNAVASGGAVEISDSGRYQESLAINIAAGQRLELRAANLHRPTLVLAGDWQVTGAADSQVTLNGLLISGGALRVDSAGLRRLRLRHCTLVPGALPSLVVTVPDVTIEIDHCILGGLRVAARSEVNINDSIIDAGAATEVAFAAPDGAAAGGSLEIRDTTLIGKVHTEEMRLASNVIFLSDLAPADTWTAPVRSEKKQDGCVRFSYLPLTSVVPRRYHCQPGADRDALRVRPQFTSLRYGDPGYGQLAQRTAREIRMGADDEAEMGAFHKLYEPQRETNLRVRLDEYLRFGLEAGIFYVT